MPDARRSIANVHENSWTWPSLEPPLNLPQQDRAFLAPEVQELWSTTRSEGTLSSADPFDNPQPGSELLALIRQKKMIQCLARMKTSILYIYI